MMNLGMDLVGVDFLYVQDKPVKDTGDSKLLWQRPSLREEWHVCTSPAAAAESPNGSGCSARSQFCAVKYAKSAWPPAWVPNCWQETLASARRAFNNDNTVRTVKMAMLQAYAKGVNPNGVTRPYILGRCLSAATRPLADFDGDCKSDVAIWRSSEVAWYVRPSTGGSPYSIRFGNPTDIPVLGDFDRDRKTDIALWRPSDGNWWVMPSNGTPIFSQQWGAPEDKPVPGDYDGDGITDMAVWRPSVGEWWVRPSGGDAPFGIQWGQEGDIPVPADYDGDGRTDMALWRPSDGTWQILSSVTNNTYQIQWGGIFDSPVPADYDGDGRADPAVFRPLGDKKLYILPSNGGASYSRLNGITIADISVAGDYDGDGQGDIVSWTPFDAVWSGWLSGTGGPV